MHYDVSVSSLIDSDVAFDGKCLGAQAGLSFIPWSNDYMSKWQQSSQQNENFTDWRYAIGPLSSWHIKREDGLVKELL